MFAVQGVYPYIYSGGLSLDHGRLEEDVLIDKAEVVVQLGHSASEHPLRRLTGALQRHSRLRKANPSSEPTTPNYLTLVERKTPEARRD